MYRRKHEILANYQQNTSITCRSAAHQPLEHSIRNRSFVQAGVERLSSSLIDVERDGVGRRDASSPRPANGHGPVVVQLKPPRLWVCLSVFAYPQFDGSAN